MSSQPPASDMTLIQAPRDASAGVVAKLIGTMPPVKGREYICQPLAQVGRDPRAARFYVNHPSMSRVHARFNKEGGIWVVEDLQSSNGVFVNGNRVQKAFLKDGDEVRFGEVNFEFKLLAAAAPALAQPASAGLSEMTVFGGEVPQFFAQEIKKEHEAPTVETTALKGQALTPATLQESRAKKYFWMKVKVVASLLMVLLVLVGGVGFLYYLATRGTEARLAFKEFKKSLDDFQDKFEEKVFSDAETPAEFAKQLKELEELKAGEKKIVEEKSGISEELKDRIKDAEQIIFYLIFEREFMLALLEKNEKKADELIAGLEENGSDEQKKVIPLVKLVKRFQLFRRMYPEPPGKSKGTPDKALVESLASVKGELNELYLSLNKYLVVVRHLGNLTRLAIDENAYFVQQWKNYWEAFDEYKAAVGDEKKTLLERMKKEYPYIEALKTEAE